MARDINKKPYDEATLTKLEIFEQYLLAWLPVFIQTPYAKQIKICDYCAGSGQDSEAGGRLVCGEKSYTAKHPGWRPVGEQIGEHRPRMARKQLVCSALRHDTVSWYRHQA